MSLITIAVLIWISTYPTKSECVASGRIVDPTERHCETSAGYEQLQEHVWFHASEVLVGVGLLVAVGYVVRYFVRRRSAAATPAA